MSTTTRITYEQFDEMIRRGDFEDAEDRYELLFGEICIMPQPDPPHEWFVEELNEWSFQAAPLDAVRVRVQGSLGIPALESVPEPDLLWLRRDDYSARRPGPDDALLVIEVAESSLAKDRGPPRPARIETTTRPALFAAQFV